MLGAQLPPPRKPSAASCWAGKVPSSTVKADRNLILSAKPGLAELLDEVDAHAAGQEHENGVGLRRRDLGELGGVIELVERDVDFVGHLALVVALEAGELILAGLIVRRHQEHLLEAGILRVLAHRLGVLVVLIGDDEQVRVAVLAGEARGAGIWADHEGAALGHRLEDRGQDVGEHRTDDEIDLVALDEGLDLGDGDVGLELVVLDQELDVAPAELAAEFLERKLKPVALLLADDGRRPRQGRDQADLHLVGSLVLRHRTAGDQRDHGGDADCP